MDEGLGDTPPNGVAAVADGAGEVVRDESAARRLVRRVSGARHPVVTDRGRVGGLAVGGRELRWLHPQARFASTRAEEEKEDRGGAAHRGKPTHKSSGI